MTDYKAKGLTDEEAKAVKEMFDFIDNGGDPFIDQNDMKVGFEKLGINLSDEKNEAIFAKYDIDSDGTIDENEFADMLVQNKGGNTLNKDGIIATLKTLA